MDLDHLCVHDNIIRFSDNVRMQERRKNPIETTDTKYVRSTVNMVGQRFTATNYSVQDKRCFYCNKVGHVRRDSRQRLREINRTEPRASKHNPAP